MSITPPDLVPPAQDLAPLPDNVRPPVRWSVFAWLMIITAVILIVGVAPRMVEQSYQEIENDANGLAFLKIQSRVIIGFHQFQPQLVANELDDLDQFATSPQMNAATAGLRFYLDPDGHGKEKALELLDAAEEYDDTGDHEYLTELRQIILGNEDPQNLNDYDYAPWYFDLYRLAKADDSDPERQKFQSDALTVAGAYGGAIIAVLILIFAGFVLLILALNAQRGKKLTLLEPRLELDGLLLTGFALYLFIMSAGDFLRMGIARLTNVDIFPVEISHGLDGAMIFFTMVGSVFAGFLWPRFRGLPWAEYRRRMGWHRGQGFIRESFSGLVGYIAMLPIFCIGVFGTILLGLLIDHYTKTDGTTAPISHPIVSELAEGEIKTKIFMFILAAVLAPLFEETMFRGALYRALRGKWNFLVSGLVSGLIFAIVHPQGIIAVPALTAMGFGFAMIREWRDSLIAPMVAHAVHNGLLVTAMLFAFS